LLCVTRKDTLHPENIYFTHINPKENGFFD